MQAAVAGCVAHLCQHTHNRWPASISLPNTVALYPCPPQEKRTHNNRECERTGGGPADERPLTVQEERALELAGGPEDREVAMQRSGAHHQDQTSRHSSPWMPTTPWTIQGGHETGRDQAPPHTTPPGRPRAATRQGQTRSTRKTTPPARASAATQAGNTQRQGGSHRPPSQPSQDTPTQDTPTQDTPTQDTPSQDTPSQDTPSQDTLTQDTLTQDTLTQDTLTQDTLTQDTLTQDTLTQGTPTQDTPTQDTPTQDTPTQDTPTQDTPTQDTETQDTDTQDTDTQDTDTQDTDTQGMGGQEPPPQGTMDFGSDEEHDTTPLLSPTPSTTAETLTSVGHCSDEASGTLTGAHNTAIPVQQVEVGAAGRRRASRREQPSAAQTDPGFLELPHLPIDVTDPGTIEGGDGQLAAAADAGGGVHPRAGAGSGAGHACHPGRNRKGGIRGGGNGGDSVRHGEQYARPGAFRAGGVCGPGHGCPLTGSHEPAADGRGAQHRGPVSAGHGPVPAGSGPVPAGHC
ncbi:uncharacterized protein [Scyliorhinus torazame]|uniref:uncharacterized protein n=1 Tax=Scyliorhinus torazame TaxID=75743 RepID=UPI003B5B647A